MELKEAVEAFFEQAKSEAPAGGHVWSKLELDYDGTLRHTVVLTSEDGDTILASQDLNVVLR